MAGIWGVHQWMGGLSCLSLCHEKKETSSRKNGSGCWASQLRCHVLHQGTWVCFLVPAPGSSVLLMQTLGGSSGGTATRAGGTD